MAGRTNFSWMREAILETLRGTDTHPTAEWIYDQLKPRYPSLSLGTVYRNLRQLCQRGEAISVGVIGGQEHFDGRVDDHAHLVCSSCGCVVDVPGAMPSKASLRRLSGQCGDKLTSVSILFRGVCKSCLHKAEKAEA